MVFSVCPNGWPLKRWLSGFVGASDIAQPGAPVAGYHLLARSSSTYSSPTQPVDSNTAEKGESVQVTATAVERPDVDLAAVRSLAMALGCVEFSSRSYHP